MRRQVTGSIIEASVLVRGMRLPVYSRDDGYPFIAGTPGRAYTLSVKNLTAGRVEVAVSVDQRDVLTDGIAGRQSAGYLLEPGAVQEVRGWRVDDGKVREFLFAGPSESVAAQADEDYVTGVIGFMAWREKRVNYASFPGSPPDPFPEVLYRASSSYAGASAGIAASDLGTGIGDYLDDRVQRVSFTRAGVPEILSLGYATREELARKGIICDPGPFPGYGRYASP